MIKLKKIIFDFTKKHYTLLSLLRNIRFVFIRASYLRYYIFTKTDEKSVIFEAYMGRQYSCSPKAIYEEMLRNPAYGDFRYIWAFREPEKFKGLLCNKNTKIVKYGSKDYYKTYAKAKYWVSNSRINERIVKRKDQVYVQCWHGTPLKKLGYDIVCAGGNSMNSTKDIRKKYKLDAKRYTFMLSPSAFCTEKFTSAFNIKNKHIFKEFGYPRNDFLFRYTEADVERIKKDLNITPGKKIILYAPTWRDNQHESCVGYTYRLGIDFSKLQKEIGDKYVILFRTHYFVANSINTEEYDGFVVNVCDYDDINDLYIVSDLLITDYSSVFFDYANLKRPIIFYMYDYDEYKNELRDFYINEDELPGPIVKQENELTEAVKKTDSLVPDYRNKYESFNKKFNYLDDGHSSERVIKECIK